jgi:hypothetical protein
MVQGVKGVFQDKTLSLGALAGAVAGGVLASTSKTFYVSLLSGALTKLPDMAIIYPFIPFSIIEDIARGRNDYKVKNTEPNFISRISIAAAAVSKYTLFVGTILGTIAIKRNALSTIESLVGNALGFTMATIIDRMVKLILEPFNEKKLEDNEVPLINDGN